MLGFKFGLALVLKLASVLKLCFHLNKGSLGLGLELDVGFDLWGRVLFRFIVSFNIRVTVEFMIRFGIRI